MSRARRSSAFSFARSALDGLEAQLALEEAELSSVRTELERARVRLSCLGRVTPGVKDTPFLGSARGTKEAVDLLTRSEFVDDEHARNREQTHNDLPRFRPPEG